MEGIKNFFDSFKEFIWDIIGYLLPGTYVLILLSACISNEYFVNSPITHFFPDLNVYVFIVISYLLGYVSYGFGWLKEKILGKRSYVKKIESNVSKRKAFSLTKELITKGLAAKGVTDDLANSTVRDIRSIAMSFIPESDQKIYTFTFRSELSNQIANISFSIGALGMLLWPIQNKFSFSLFLSDHKHIILYVCLMIVYFFLREARDRFYAMSINLPFSIYTAKMINK